MIYDRKGLSAIIVTLILVLLSIVAVGAVWVVVNNVLQKGQENVNLGSACIDIDVSISSATCTFAGGGDDCTVTYGRTASGGEIGGITLIFSNSIESKPLDVVGNLAPLVTQTKTSTDLTGNTIENVDKIGIAAYLADSSGTKQQTCSVREFSLS